MAGEDVRTLYNNIIAQNAAMQNTLDNLTNNDVMASQKAMYLEQQINGLFKINTYILYLYLALLTVVLYKLYLKPAWKMYTRVGIFVAFLLYPVLIGIIETYLAVVWNYLYALINVNAYRNM